MKRIKSPWLSFYVTCLGIFLFYLFCARLLIKTDDGHFLGILNNPGFGLLQWLSQRYHTTSGRTISEGLMMTFLRAPLFFWKVCTAALLCAVIWIFCRLSLAVPGPMAAKHRISFACGASLLVLPTCMSAGAYWFAGSFTYLWPMAALALCVMPCAFELLGVPGRPWLYALSLLAAPVAASQEQSAAAVIAMLLCMQLLLLQKKKWRVRAALPLLPAGVCAWLLFSSPGAQLRSAEEAKSGFPAFLEMSFPEKLLCGFSNYFAYAFFLSVPVMTVFLLLLYHHLKKHRKAVIAHGSCWIALCLGGNLLTLAQKRGIPDQLFETLFLSGQWDLTAAALLAVSALFFLSTVFLLLLLARERPEMGLAAGLCFAAAVGCGIAPGFSGSVYASGQRIFFFSELFTLLAAALLFGGTEDSRRIRALRVSVTALMAAFAVFHVAGIKFLEIPPMG
ncbi:MAG: DUF6056 family protein [Oscillospiraceae bacterium]|nr:DUF6056 family protein [Oscillospiraceae bacterium]